MRGISKKLCPLLQKFGVFYNGKRLVNGSDDYWIKKLCLGGKCPLILQDKPCIYDKAGKITDEDREALEKAGAINKGGIN